MIDVHPEWAPNAAERFATMLQENLFDGMRFFKVITGFSAHFGIPGSPALAAQWKDKPLVQDHQKEGNARGRISFVTDDSRPTEMVISIKDNDFFDGKGYVPFAEVVEGMFFIDRLSHKYGSKVKPGMMETEGNAYLTKEFPALSYIESVQLVEQKPDSELPIQDDTLEFGSACRSVILAVAFSMALVAIWSYFGTLRGSGVEVKV